LENNIIIFDKHYTDEDLIDLEHHIWNMLNDNIAEIPVNEHGFREGTFRVTIEWIEE